MEREIGEPVPSFDSPEGATMVATGKVLLDLDAEAVRDLHRVFLGDLDGWLDARLADVVYALLSAPDFVPLTRGQIPAMEMEGLRLLDGAGLEAVGLRLVRVLSPDEPHLPACATARSPPLGGTPAGGTAGSPGSRRRRQVIAFNQVLE